MTRPWSEPIRMIILGLLSVGAVVAVSELFSRPTHQRPDTSPDLTAGQFRRLRDDVDARDRAMERRLSELEASVRDLRQRVASAEAMEPREPSRREEAVPNNQRGDVPLAPESNTSQRSSPVQEALIRGSQYVAKHEYDPNNHNRVLSDLVAAYAVRGLSPEENRFLLATIQQVNEIGVAWIISQARRFPTSDSSQRLQAFLETTPKLTAGQVARIRTALRGNL